MADADTFTADSGAERQSRLRDLPEVTRARRPWRVPLMLLVPIFAVGGGLWYWFGSPGEVSTDNAYIKQDVVSIAGEITGLVVQVNVHENQHVKAGDVLYTIDPSTFRVAIAQADAQIATAQAQVTALQSDVGANTADLAGARDDLALAEAVYAREKALMERGFNTRARIDETQYAVASARDHLASIQAQVEKARAQLATGAQVPGVNPAIAAAQAQRAQAELNLSRTVIRAPANGTVTQSGRLMVGQMAFPGVPMLSLMRDGGARVDANFKETDLAHMRPGQPVDIRLDAYPDVKLKGHVESLGAGTGSEFSILPAQNATGNWVKITQRVPVRIAIDSKSDRPLIAGLSTTVTVHVGH